MNGLRLRLYLVLVLLLLPVSAWADFFIFNATTKPTTGTYIPVGSGHYNLHGDAEYFQNLGAIYADVAPGDQVGAWTFAQGEIIPTVPGVDCSTPIFPPTCTWNYVKYFSTPGWKLLGSRKPTGSWSRV